MNHVAKLSIAVLLALLAAGLNAMWLSAAKRPPTFVAVSIDVPQGQPIVDEIEEDVLAIERRALDSFLSRDDVTHLFNLRQTLMRFRRMLGPMEEVCARLEHIHLPFMDPDVRPYFRDVGDRAVDSHVKNLRRKIEAVVPGAHCIRSVYGIGYRFEPKSLEDAGGTPTSA
jgi:hypothetical protein